MVSLSDPHRRFRKTSQFIGRQVFGVDIVGYSNDADSIPHFRDQGLNAMFTDGSVVFNKSPKVWKLISASSVVDNVAGMDRLCFLIDSVQ